MFRNCEKNRFVKPQPNQSSIAKSLYNLHFIQLSCWETKETNGRNQTNSTHRWISGHHLPKRFNTAQHHSSYHAQLYHQANSLHNEKSEVKTFSERLKSQVDLDQSSKLAREMSQLPGHGLTGWTFMSRKLWQLHRCEQVMHGKTFSSFFCFSLKQAAVRFPTTLEYRGLQLLGNKWSPNPTTDTANESYLREDYISSGLYGCSPNLEKSNNNVCKRSKMFCLKQRQCDSTDSSIIHHKIFAFSRKQ